MPTLTPVAGAPLNSPTFTGDPKAPTAAVGDNDTSLATTAYVTAAILSGFVFTRITDYGAVGDNSTDNTTAINNCLSAVNTASAGKGGIVWVPYGTFLANDLVWYSNIQIRGAGAGSILRQKSGVADNTYLLSAFGSGATVASNVTGVGLYNLQLQGRCDTDTFTQYVHLVELSGVSDATIEGVFFSKWRGDAIILASNLNGGTQVERHNERIKIRRCRFDGGGSGGTNNNRNAITIQDCAGLTVEDNDFANCTASTMPGAIDIEPNAVTYTVLRDINIIKNRFTGVGGDAGVIGMNLSTAQASLTTPMSGLRIESNTIRGNFNSTGAVFLRQQQTPTDSTERNEVFLVDNHILDDPGVPVELEGLRGVRMERNYFARTQFAFSIGSLNLCLDISLAWSDLYQVGLTEGTAVGIYNVTRFDILNNVFDAIGDQAGTGRLVAFNGTASSSKIRFIGNRQIGFASTSAGKAGTHTVSVDTNEWYDNDTTVFPAATIWSQQPLYRAQQQVVTDTYSSSITPDAVLGSYRKITPTNTTAFTINAPTNPVVGQILTFDFLNSSGGAMGAITWNAAFKLAGAFTNPASTKRRTIMFQYDGTNWVELNRAAADI